jgi:hypothetical protein
MCLREAYARHPRDNKSSTVETMPNVDKKNDLDHRVVKLQQEIIKLNSRNRTRIYFAD